MHRFSFILFTFIIAPQMAACAGNAVAQADQEVPTGTSNQLEPVATPAVISGTPSADCPLTIPPDPPFVPPAPYDTLGFKDEFWYGSPSLWTAIWYRGVWEGLPYDPSSGYSQKIFWWREGYVWTEEPEPALIVTGERLDSRAPPLRASNATNAYADDIGSAMLTGVEFPTEGCWKITGKYGDTELSFVVWVAP